jgi:LmbE family N-acetylglucosaminyl deacetylase
MMKIMGITAHPDDEVGAFGGTLLFYHSRGVETFVICLTCGEAATYRGEARSNEELAAIRSNEFLASCRVLQVTGAQILGYPDGGLNRTDMFSVVGDLTRRVREIRPHIIMSMGTEGAVTGHPDHAMASVFATMAFHWAARKDMYPEQLLGGLEPHRAQKLYYATAPFLLPDRPPVSPPPCTAEIDVSGFVEEKLRASREHATQAPLMARFAKAIREHPMSKEQFHLAATNSPSLVAFETDLLAGVV